MGVWAATCCRPHTTACLGFMIKILSVSDKVDEVLYSPALKRLFADVDLVLGCGDLPFYYLEFIVTMLGGPLFYVIGNHANAVRQQYAPREEWQYPLPSERPPGHVGDA